MGWLESDLFENNPLTVEFLPHSGNVLDLCWDRESHRRQLQKQFGIITKNYSRMTSDITKIIISNITTRQQSVKVINMPMLLD